MCHALCWIVYPRSLGVRNVALCWDCNLIFYSSNLAKNVCIDGSVSNMLGRNWNVFINDADYWELWRVSSSDTLLFAHCRNVLESNDFCLFCSDSSPRNLSLCLFSTLSVNKGRSPLERVLLLHGMWVSGDLSLHGILFKTISGTACYKAFAPFQNQL